MKHEIFIIVLIILTIFLSFNIVSAGNYTDLNQDISDNDFVELTGDIVLNENTSNEENAFKEGISIVDKQIHIEGNNHTICGKDSNQNHARAFNIKNSTVTLSNMIISSAAFEGSGGAIILDSKSNLILRNVTFKDNSALGIYGEGGAIYSIGQTFAYDCLFVNNYASGAAGAIHSPYLNCYIQSSKFINNSAKWYGGALYSGCLIEVNSSYFEDNHAFSGAAFHYALDGRSYDGAYAFLINSNFIANVANEGGAISVSSHRDMTIVGCNFKSNHAKRGGAFYENSISNIFIHESSFDNNSADIGALFYEETVDSSSLGPFAFTLLENCTLTNNHVSDKASIFYAKSSNIMINSSLIDNNANNPIYMGKGNITVLNSNISNYGQNFITLFVSGNIFVVNNTWGTSNPNYENILNNNGKSIIHNEVGKLNIIDQNNFASSNVLNISSNECCSVFIRINETDYVISQRRDGGDTNYTLHIVSDENYIKEFKPFAEYYLLSKVYTNGWCYSNGGWDDSAQNEKIEAIANDMAFNQIISMEALELILETKMMNEVGHFLIVAPNGTWGNLITFHGDTYIDMGVLADGGYIISPNDPDYRVEGILSDIANGVDENINLSSRDNYGFNRHCIVAHHITLNENGFSDSIYVSNEDGKFINQTNGIYCDSFWFKEQFINETDIPVVLDKLYLGTFYDLKRTVISDDATRGYNSDYVFIVQLLRNDGEYLVNEEVNITVNGKTNEYITNKEGIIKIPFYGLTSTQSITVKNPVTGEVVKNTIKVVPRLVGSNVVMDYFDGSKYQVKVYDEAGKLAGEGQIVVITLNKKTYKVKTNSKGIAILTIPNTLVPNSYSLTASYAGQTIKNTIKVKQILKTKNRAVKKSAKKLVLKATLKTSKNKAIKNKIISFKFKGKTYKAKTNKKGIAKVTLKKKVLKKLKVSKKYTLKVVYLKDTVKAKIKVKR